MPAHVGKGGVRDHVVAVPGAQQVQEVQPALRLGRGEPGEAVVADLGAHPVHPLVAGAGVVDRDPPRRLQSGAQHTTQLAQEPRLEVGQRPPNLTLKDSDTEVVERRHQTRRAISSRKPAAVSLSAATSTRSCDTKPSSSPCERLDKSICGG